MPNIRATAASMPASLVDLKANAVSAVGILVGIGGLIGTVFLLWNLNAMANQIYIIAG